jgi:hypothetical protein
MMKIPFVLSALILALAACVPAKKYQELLAKSEQCDQELAAMKHGYLNYEGENKEIGRAHV